MLAVRSELALGVAFARIIDGCSTCGEDSGSGNLDRGRGIGSQGLSWCGAGTVLGAADY